MSAVWQNLDRTLVTVLLVLVAWLLLRSYEVGDQSRAIGAQRYEHLSRVLDVNHDLLQANRKATADFAPKVDALCIATNASCPGVQ